MKVKEESGKTGLKFKIQKTKITASPQFPASEIKQTFLSTNMAYLLTFKRWFVRSHTVQQHLYAHRFSWVTDMSDSLWPRGLQHTKFPCPSPTPRACSNTCPSSRWCHPTISSFVPFSSCLQSFPASGFFPMNQFFPSGGQGIGISASASDLPMNTENLFPLGWTGLISLQSRGLSRVFSNTIVQKHQFFSTQFFYSPTLTFIHGYWKNHSFD